MSVVDEVAKRHAKVLAMYTKRMTQGEIAEALGVNQSTVSRDLKQLRKRMKKEIKTDVFDNLWEFSRYLSGTDMVIKRMWEIAEDRQVATKDRMEALVQLMDFYAGRGLEVLISPGVLEEPEKDREMYGR
jgi:DNA-binding Lrp family transcriptional regulator